VDADPGGQQGIKLILEGHGSKDYEGERRNGECEIGGHGSPITVSSTDIHGCGAGDTGKEWDRGNLLGGPPWNKS
jgi:hypothetical protein